MEAQLNLLGGEIGESQWRKGGVIQLVLRCINIEELFAHLLPPLPKANHLIVNEFW